MTYQRFEDIPVWQAAIVLAERVFGLTADRAFAGQGDIANQIQRAGLSVSNNVAEGFERGSTNELIAFLYYARGSAGEVRSTLCLLERMERFKHLKSEISDVKSVAESCSRQLRGWAEHLQNTAIRGQRHLNDGTRAEFRGLADGLLAGLAGGSAHGEAGIGKLVAVRVGPINAGRDGTEIMERLDLDQVGFPRLENAGPERIADAVAELDRGKAELPDFLQHVVAVMMPVRVPGGGKCQRRHAAA